MHGNARAMGLQIGNNLRVLPGSTEAIAAKVMSLRTFFYIKKAWHKTLIPFSDLVAGAKDFSLAGLPDFAAST